MCKRLPSEQTENTNKRAQKLPAAPQRNLIKYHVIWAAGGEEVEASQRIDRHSNAKQYNVKLQILLIKVHLILFAVTTFGN